MRLAVLLFFIEVLHFNFSISTFSGNVYTVQKFGVGMFLKIHKSLMLTKAAFI